MELKKRWRAVSSLARLADAIATRKEVLNYNNLRLEEAIGSKGGRIRALRTSCNDH